MNRILKALLKTIVVVLAIAVFIFLGNKFPALLATLLIIIMIIYLFFTFYESEED